MYKAYFEEMGSEVIETPYGWANYIFDEDSCYIENMYITPEYRRTKKGSELADKIAAIAKERGSKYLLTTTNTKKPSVERSIQAIIGYGFKFLRSSESAIFYYKEL